MVVWTFFLYHNSVFSPAGLGLGFLFLYFSLLSNSCQVELLGWICRSQAVFLLRPTFLHLYWMKWSSLVYFKGIVSRLVLVFSKICFQHSPVSHCNLIYTIKPKTIYYKKDVYSWIGSFSKSGKLKRVLELIMTYRLIHCFLSHCTALIGKSAQTESWLDVLEC